MARMRTIKPEFFRSRSLAKCSRDSRLTLQGLWCEADDHGHGVADPRILKGAIWPLDDDITHVEVGLHLKELIATDHILTYQIDGNDYYLICQWEKHQSAAYRRGDPKYPLPPAEMQTCRIVQDAQDALLKQGTGNREQGTGKGNAEKKKTEEDELEAEFDECWKSYPRKIARKTALAAYVAQRRKAVPAEVLLIATKHFAQQMAKEDREQDRILHGSTFFGPHDRWEDFVDEPAKPYVEPVPKGAGQLYDSEEERVAAYGERLYLPGEVKPDGTTT